MHVSPRHRWARWQFSSDTPWQFPNITPIGAGDVVPQKKPAPDVYLWVLDRLGLRADECLAIEDSAPGAAAARAAGIPVLVTRSRYTAGDALPPVLADLDHLGEAHLPAQGTVAGRPWQGIVTPEQLRAWCSAAVSAA